MVQTCRKCSRVNPADAAYCYFDGMVLDGHARAGGNGPVRTGTQLFPQQFVFPTGLVCRTFNELAVACHENWSAAVGLLRQGYLENFLGGLGRADLARAAQEAARYPDPSRGLDQLLGKLPADVVEPPQLDLTPREVNLGLLKVGEDRQLDLHLTNLGMRLLYGSISCEDAVWLAVGEGHGAPRKLFECDCELMVPLHVRGKALRAGKKPIESRVVIDSNGGQETVIVRAEVPVQPFPDGVLGGARSPRQVAEKAKEHPKEAAALFEQGAVARWYEANGWKYPVQGPSASGVAAVQQFFEALGLTPPPKVEVSERAVALQGTVGDRLQHALQVKTQEKRPVYAHGRSDQPWLEVGRARLNGRTATIPLVVPAVPDREGETLQARLTVTANGNQRFVIPVTLGVGGSFNFGPAAAAAPPMTAAPQPAPVAVPVAQPAPPPQRGPTGVVAVWLHALPAAALALALAVVVLWDIKRPVNVADTAVQPGGVFRLFDPTMLRDAEPRIGVQFTEFNQRFGIVLLKEPDPENLEKKKRLTFDESGNSNNTCTYVDGAEYLFGKTPPGSWVVDTHRTLLKHVAVPVPGSQGWKTVWQTPEGVRVTQTVMIVPGAQSLVLDTCLVEYVVENHSEIPHRVGLRVMLDTFIGTNDGVPFAIPGQPGLLTTMHKFGQKEIPDYIQALERPSLKDPGTVAQIGLKLPGFRLRADDPDPDPMESLLICRWPGNSEELWDWTPKPMNDPPDKKDSCVTMYWATERMSPHGKRSMVFTYGLGTLSSSSAQLALTVGGAFRPGGTFTVTAYVKSPQDGQRVRIELPPGLALVPGQELEQPVRRDPGGYSQVSWRVRADAAGRYPVRATSGSASAESMIQIHEGGGLFGL
jgi:hypothetical protein